jgi:two-component system, sensor histidine kinase and response regulator
LWKQSLVVFSRSIFYHSISIVMNPLRFLITLILFLSFLIPKNTFGLNLENFNADSTARKLYQEYILEQDQHKKLSLLSEFAWKIHLTDSAQIYYEEAVSLAKSIGDTSAQAKNLNRLGVKYRNLDQQEEALKVYEEALTLAKTSRDLIEQGYALNNIGQIHFYQEQYEEALSFYVEAEKAFSQEKFKDGLGYTYTGMSAVYGYLGEFDNALDLINKAIEIREELGNNRQYMVSIYNRGQLYAQMKNYEEAEKDIKIFLNYSQANDKRGEILALGKLAKIYLENGKRKQARVAAEEAITLNSTTPSIEGMVAVYDLLYNLSLAEGNPEEARQHLDNLIEAKSSLNEEKTRMRLLALTIRKQKDDIAALNREKALVEKNEQFKMIIAYILLILVVVLYIAFHIYYKSYKKEEKNLELLQVQKNQIEKQAEELDRLNLVKDKIFSILAHDLRGPLYSLQGLVQLIQEDNLTQDEFESYIPLISQNLGNNSLLLENLLIWSRSQMRGMEARVARIELRELVQKNMDFLHGSNYFKEQLLLNNVPEEIFVLADKNMLDIVIRNLLTNAMKFTRKNDIISIDVQEDLATYTVEVVDQGTGIAEDALPKLFGTEFFTTPGTHLEKGSGLGLLLSKELIQKNNGKIWVQSTYGQGSKFSFTLPKC